MPSPVHYIVRNLTINKATVITSLASAIPVVGNHIVSWLWGGQNRAAIDSNVNFLILLYAGKDRILTNNVKKKQRLNCFTFFINPKKTLNDCPISRGFNRPSETKSSRPCFVGWICRRGWFLQYQQKLLINLSDFCHQTS